MPSDSLLEMLDDIDPESAERWRRHHDHMDRTFGHRPDGQEHRAWVEHDTLRALDPADGDWDRALNYLGLADLPTDDPELPAELKQLLAPSGLRTALPMLLVPGVAAAVGVTAAAVARSLGVQAPFGGLAVGITVAGIFASVVLASVLGDALAAWRRKATGRPAWWTLRASTWDALDALERRPFVVPVGDMLVENLPTWSRLQGCRRDLAGYREEAERRRDRARDLAGQLRKAARKVGETGHDAALESVKTVAGDANRQVKRIEGLQEKVASRLALLEKRLTEIRDRARLEHLRDKARDLAGEPPDDGPWHVAAELELDVTELVDEVLAVGRDLVGQTQRFKALSEIARIV